MTKVLNEKQQKFMAVLFDEAGGDVTLAKKLAGYSDTTATSHVIKGLKDEIADATKEYMARVAPRAAVAMGNALLDPTELGIRDKMTAAKDLLDRAGFIKTEMTDKIPEEYKTKLISRIPAGDLGTGEDVSNCVAFLASDMANYINGETIHVNGGMYMA